MKLPILTVCFIVLAAVTACNPDETGQTETTGAMSETTSSEIEFTGDFAGPLGLQLWSVREYTKDDVPGTLARVRNMGFTEVELAGTYGMPPAEFRAILDEAGLQATSMHGDYLLFRDSLDTVLDAAEALGVEYVGLAWLPPEFRAPFSEDVARREAAHLNTWGAAARERGLKMFYHIHGYEFRPGPDGTTPFDVMVEETDPALVSFEIDAFWVAHTGTDPAALIRKYPDRWTLMHVKDMRVGTPIPDHSGAGTAKMDVPVGTGLIDYRDVLRAARDAGIVRYYIEDESDDPLSNIPRSVDFLAKVAF